jgi:hypothetical protein
MLPAPARREVLDSLRGPPLQSPIAEGEAAREDKHAAIKIPTAIDHANADGAWKESLRLLKTPDEVIAILHRS